MPAAILERTHGQLPETQGDPAAPLLDIVSAEQFTPEYIRRVVGEAAIVNAQLGTPEGDEVLAATWPTGRLVSTLYERSTRTRGSTEAAAAAVGMRTISFPDAAAEAKDESLEDAAIMYGAQGHVWLLRHPSADAPRVVVPKLEEYFTGWRRPALIIGGAGERYHPTQALVDAARIERDFGRLNNLHTVIFGGFANRTAWSYIEMMSKFPDNSFTFVSAGDSDPYLALPEGMPGYLDDRHIPYEITPDFRGALKQANAVYACRVKNERREGQEPLPPPHVVGPTEADIIRHAGGKIYHALPRAGEIDPAIDGSCEASYMHQAIGAVSVRVVLLRDARAAKINLYENSRRLASVA